MLNLSARKLGIIVAIALPLLSLHFYRPTQRGIWIEAALEFMHVPVFGLVAVGLFALLRGHFRLRIRVAIVAGATLLLGVMSEAAQIPIARDASLEDLFRNMAGGIAGLLCCIAFSSERHYRLEIRVMLLLLAILVILPAAVPIANVTLAYVERYQQLPVLIRGNQHNAMKFVRGPDAETASIIAGASGDQCILVNARKDRGPGLAFQSLWPDWSAHSFITISLENMSSTALEIVVRVHDTKHRAGSQPHGDRYNRIFMLDEGPNVLVIALEDIVSAPSNRTLDIRSIDGMGIFSNDKRRDASFCVYEIRLNDSSS